MATGLVLANMNANADWAEIQGAAASTAGVTWQNVGKVAAGIAFVATAPDGDDAYHILQPGQAFYDKNGSAKVWAKPAGIGSASLSATAD